MSNISLQKFTNFLCFHLRVLLRLARQTSSGAVLFSRFCLLPLLVFCFLLITQSASAQTPANSVNGCGSGGWGVIVPDKTILSRCSFVQACNNHDLCYGRCLPGGDLTGQSTCTNSDERAARRLVCDRTLYGDIVTLNNGKAMCKAYGVLYRWAVETFGKDYFHGLTAAQLQIEKLNEFFAYVDEHPNAFSDDALDSIVQNLSSLPDEKTYQIEFLSYIPKLTVLSFPKNPHSGAMKVELVIEGKAND